MKASRSTKYWFYPDVKLIHYGRYEYLESGSSSRPLAGTLEHLGALTVSHVNRILEYRYVLWMGVLGGQRRLGDPKHRGAL
jgi:hypothetical protein